MSSIFLSEPHVNPVDQSISGHQDHTSLHCPPECTIPSTWCLLFESWRHQAHSHVSKLGCQKGSVPWSDSLRRSLCIWLLYYKGPKRRTVEQHVASSVASHSGECLVIAIEWTQFNTSLNYFHVWQVRLSKAWGCLFFTCWFAQDTIWNIYLYSNWLITNWGRGPVIAHRLWGAVRVSAIMISARWVSIG